MSPESLESNSAMVPTGVPLLDTALEGGVKPGSFILALGEPTSGMELLTKQFAAQGTGPNGGQVLVWSTDESADEWRGIMARFGDTKGVHIADIASEYFERVYGAKLTPKEGIRVRGILPSAQTARPKPEDLAIPDFLNDMVGTMHAMRPGRTVLDSLDFFAELYDSKDIIRTVRALRIVNRDAGGVFLVTKIRGTSDPGLEIALEHVADVVLDFSVEPSAQNFSWTLTIKKFRNEPQRAGSVLYNPTPTGLARDTRRRV